MRIPQFPPRINDLLNAKVSVERFVELLKKLSLVDYEGRYLHWDDLRHKKSPDGMTSEEWWITLRTARKAAAQNLPFADEVGKSFFYTEPPELKSLLRFIDVNAAGVLETQKKGIKIEDGKRYLRRSLAEEPFASSLIEGAVTTRDIAKKMIFENLRPRTRDERMVYNNYRGMEFVKSIQEERLTPEKILELHHIMTEGTLDDPSGAGRLRTAADEIAVMDDSTGEVIHMPPAAETLPERMTVLCNFANAVDDDKTYCHPILRAMSVHFMLAYDHPFVDGNGRTARALFYWMAMKAGYWLMEYTSISSVIAKAPTVYYKAFLYTETDEGDLTYFFLHQARVIQDALKRLHEYAEAKRKQNDNLYDAIAYKNMQLNGRQISVLQDFMQRSQKIITIGEHQDRKRVSRITARNDLEDLVHKKLIARTKQGRNVVYRPVVNLAERLLEKD